MGNNLGLITIYITPFDNEKLPLNCMAKNNDEIVGLKSDQQVCRRVVMFIGRHYYRRERQKRKRLFKRIIQKI